MLSKNKSAFLISLQKKKERDKTGLFIIEGDKLVMEFILAGAGIKLLAAKPEFINSLSAAQKEGIEEIEPASFDELRKISTLKTPHNALAVASIPVFNSDLSFFSTELTVALDFVQDPGNLGTIIRAASWFGIKNVICSPDCVDVYNPKVIQATMGAILYVRIRYENLEDLLKKAAKMDLPVYGTFLSGESVYTHELGSRGIILFGNESKGISEGLFPFISTRLVIPKSARDITGTESLNVGMAASIVLSEFARRIYPVDR
jgi:TrmH family RNA methyltransferase